MAGTDAPAGIERARDGHKNKGAVRRNNDHDVVSTGRTEAAKRRTARDNVAVSGGYFYERILIKYCARRPPRR